MTTSNLIVVSANQVYSLDSSGSATSLGAINSNGGPVSMIDNGTQVALFDGQNGWLITLATNVMTQITLPFTGTPGIASYQDGFGLLTQVGTQTIWQSNLNDLGTWNVLNFGTANTTAEPIAAIAELDRAQWVLKYSSAEIFIDAGASGFAFQRLDGVFPETGCVAPYSVAKAGNSLMWLTQNTQGYGQVVRTSGYSTNVVSTHSVEREWQTYPRIDDAIAYAYQQEGHLFYVITFPGGDATWSYDVTESERAKEHLWHQRAQFANGQFHRHLGNTYAFFNGAHLVGDYQSGNIYQFNLSGTTDNYLPRKWLRSWRALEKPSIDPVRFSALQIDMQTGIGVPDGTDPQLILRWSDDGGHTFSSERFGSAGKTGETGRRVKFNRLGSTRRNSGLDRIFELSSTDQFAVALLGAELT